MIDKSVESDAFNQSSSEVESKDETSNVEELKSKMLQAIEDRNKAKRKNEELLDAVNKLQSEFKQYKSSVESDTRNMHKSTGNVEELEKSYNTALQAKNDELERIKQQAEEWRIKQNSMIIDSQINKLTLEKLSEKGADLFNKLYQSKLVLTEDNNIKIKDDVRSVQELVLHFVEEYPSLAKNPVKAGMSSTSNTSNGNMSGWTKEKLDMLSDDELRKLALSDRKLVQDYYNNLVKN